MTPVIPLLFFFMSLLVCSCSKYDRVRQIRTVADMQTIVAKIEALRRQMPDLKDDSAKVRGLILSISRGRDAWQHELLYFSQPAGSRFSYVLVSMGSDGKSDVADSQEYFAMAERIIHDEPWRDIVFRDGHPVTRAGK
jgi:hypothetical protein